ncbi:nuclear transport factor 2 family protein [Pedococcus sp. NPDC057267]|uniref:nuclear transport factor 2 family protein n=1 Tax=Pedococcus sp. NPDC057267 TaxID=3346077 RepID=UPI00363282B5
MTEGIGRTRSRAWARPWVAVVAAALLAGGAGAAGGYAVGHEEPPSGLASAKVVAVVDGTLAALGRGDWTTFGSHFAPDAVYEEPGPGAAPVTGRDRIVEVNRSLFAMGARYHRTGAILQRGHVVSYAVSCPGCPGADEEIDIAVLDDQLRFVHYWMITGGG